MRTTALSSINKNLNKWSNKWPDDHVFENADPLFQILKRFREEYVQDNPYNPCESDYLEGWECGLWQIVDLQVENICSLLPYLLTAYVYNFSDENSMFVSTFLKRVKEKNLDKDIDWCTCREQDFQSDSFKENYFSYGIGKLLTSTCDKSGPFRKELEKHANRFRFPNIYLYSKDNVVQTDSDEDETDEDYKEYGLRIDGKPLFDISDSVSNQFFNRVKELQESLFIPDIHLYSKNYKGKRLYTEHLLLSKSRYDRYTINGKVKMDNDFQDIRIWPENYMYRKIRFISIFCFFYGISSEILKQKDMSPNALYNYLLILDAFRDELGIDRLISFFKRKSVDNITALIDSVLISNYEKLKLFAQQRKKIENEKDNTDSSNKDATTIG